MKTFNYLVINKSDMRNIHKYIEARDAASHVYNAHTKGNYSNYIIIKNEKIVADMNWLVDIPEENHIKHQRLVKYLEKL